ncbi:hypothetical protein ACJX0J_040090, partial [Zea mays]
FLWEAEMEVFFPLIHSRSDRLKREDQSKHKLMITNVVRSDTGVHGDGKKCGRTTFLIAEVVAYLLCAIEIQICFSKYYNHILSGLASDGRTSTNLSRNLLSYIINIQIYKPTLLFILVNFNITQNMHKE